MQARIGRRILACSNTPARFEIYAAWILIKIRNYVKSAPYTTNAVAAAAFAFYRAECGWRKQFTYGGKVLIITATNAHILCAAHPRRHRHCESFSD